MPALQDVFNRLQASKKEKSQLSAMYRQALKDSREHAQVTEDLAKLKERKKKIEDSIRDSYARELDKLEILKTDIMNDEVLLSDAALARYVKGETVEVVDEKSRKYEPIFKVSFRRVP
jgi:hypothetical protein